MKRRNKAPQSCNSMKRHAEMKKCAPIRKEIDDIAGMVMLSASAFLKGHGGIMRLPAFVFALLLTCAIQFAYAQTEVRSPPCHAAQDRHNMALRNPGFTVFAFGTQLSAVEQDFLLFPATDIGTFNWSNLLLTTDPIMRRNAMLWANRCIKPDPNGLTCNGGGNDKGNPWDFNYIPGAAVGDEGKRIWAFFDASHKANSCTALQMIHLLGKSYVPSSYRASLESGLHVIVIGKDTTWDTLREQTAVVDWVRQLPDATKRRWEEARMRLGNVAYPKDGDRQTLNACVVRDDEDFPAARRISPVLDGVVIDYEVADLRHHTDTTQLAQSIKQVRDLFTTATGRSLPLTLYTNPLNRSAVSSGINLDNARDLLRMMDKIVIHEDHMRDHPTSSPGIVPLSVRDNINEQLRILRGRTTTLLTAEEKKKVLLVFEMKHFSDPVWGDHYTTRLQAASEARAAVLGYGLGGVMLWRNGMDFTQACNRDEWRAFSCITLGSCIERDRQTAR